MNRDSMHQLPTLKHSRWPRRACITRCPRTFSARSISVHYPLDAADNSLVGCLRINYLHNALGQRVFKSDPNVNHHEPNEREHGSVFTHWLRSNFAWLFGNEANKHRNQLGIAFTYDDVMAGSGNTLLGEYGSGGNYSAGRAEYIWLPMVSGELVPVGVYRNGRLYAVHSDHLTTPRQITDDKNQAVWQWPYSAFGETKPTGVLKSIRHVQHSHAHVLHGQNQNQNLASFVQLQASAPAIDFNLRFPGQYSDWETGLFYNGFRSYSPNLGAYTQMDPLGLAGGLNRRGYVQGNALQYTDPTGELTRLPGPRWSAWPNFAPGVRTDVSPRPPAPPPYNPVTDTYTPAPPAPVLPTPYIPIPVVTIINTIVDACSPSNSNEREKKCEAQLERDEALCLVARAAHGTRGQAICLAKAKEL